MSGWGRARPLKEQLRADLTTAMKARDELRTATLRMVLSAVSAEEVAGKEARELTDDEVQAVLRREAKKRREAAEAFGVAPAAPSRPRGSRPRARCWPDYLPAQLDDADLAAIVADAVTRTGASGMKDMGQVMGAVQARRRRPGRRAAGWPRRSAGSWADGQGQRGVSPPCRLPPPLPPAPFRRRRRRRRPAAASGGRSRGGAGLARGPARARASRC